jgi:GR25 family glycosyltransferase involved in LPS biosynthesis
MKIFLVASRHEVARSGHIQALKTGMPSLTVVEAVYPAHEHVPFLSQIQSRSKQRTGKTLQPGEIGCLLSHRKVWREIRKQAENDTEAFLVLESDSVIQDQAFLDGYFNTAHQTYDLFFWGSFDGRVALLKRKPLVTANGYAIGTPLINSLYCTYGYSLNRKAAVFLLDQTRRVNYPVDHWKRRLAAAPVKTGSIRPEVISTEAGFTSAIRGVKKTNLYQAAFDGLINIKNKIISFIA